MTDSARIPIGIPVGKAIRQCTEMRFPSFLSGGFITVIVVNPPEKKLAKRTSVHCGAGAIAGFYLVTDF